MARPIDPEMIATEKTVCYLRFLPHHMGPHGKAAGSVRRHKDGGESLDKRLFLGVVFFKILFY